MGFFTHLLKGAELIVDGDFLTRKRRTHFFNLLCFLASPQYRRTTTCSWKSQHSATCTTVPGFGNNLIYRVTVDGVNSAWLPTEGHYSSPTISAITGPGPLALSRPFHDALTRGGEIAVISGSNFGPTNEAPISANYSVGNAVYIARNCRVVQSHSIITCETAPGAGERQRWSLSVGGVTSTTPSSSYAPPEIRSIKIAANLSLAIGGARPPMSTSGGERISLEGINLGRENDLDWVRYGNAQEYEAVNCVVIVDHVRITCTTVAGVGHNLPWTISVGGQASVVSETIRMSYRSPSLHSVGNSLPTTGGFLSVNASSTGLGVVGTSRFILVGTQRLPVVDFDSISHGEFDELVFFVPALEGDAPSSGMVVSCYLWLAWMVLSI